MQVVPHNPWRLRVLAGDLGGFPYDLRRQKPAKAESKTNIRRSTLATHASSAPSSSSRDTGSVAAETRESGIDSPYPPLHSRDARVERSSSSSPDTGGVAAL
jgi:hypothetical protein